MIQDVFLEKLFLRQTFSDEKIPPVTTEFHRICPKIPPEVEFLAVLIPLGVPLTVEFLLPYVSCTHRDLSTRIGEYTVSPF